MEERVALLLIASLDPRGRAEAEELESLRATPGFSFACATLSHRDAFENPRVRSALASRPDLPVPESSILRKYALVVLKNAVDTKWRRPTRAYGRKERERRLREGPPPIVPDDERATVKTLLITQISNENDFSVAKARSFALGRIARLDWPNEWENVFGELIEMCAALEEDPVRLLNACDALHCVVDEVSEKRLRSDREAFEALSMVLVPQLLPIALRRFNELNWTSVVLVVQRTLKRLLSRGDSNLLRLPVVESYFARLAQCLSSEEYDDERRRVALKTIRDVHENHSIEFERYARPFLELSVRRFGSPPGANEDIVLTLQVVSSILGDSNYLQLCAPEDVRALTRFSCGNSTASKLNAAELEDWRADPEAFFLKDKSLTPQESATHACRHLFLVLLEKNPAIVLEELLEAFTASIQIVENVFEVASSSAGVDESLSRRVLQTDVVWTAMGLSSFHLHAQTETFVFSTWYERVLDPLLKGGVSKPFFRGERRLTTDVGRILVRRACFVLSCFACDLRPDLRAKACNRLVTLIGDSAQDVVCRLSAVDCLSDVVRDVDFDPRTFDRDRALKSVVCCMSDLLNGWESRSNCVALLSVLVTKCCLTQNSSYHALCDALTTSWTMANDESDDGEAAMMKTSVLGLLNDALETLPDDAFLEQRVESVSFALLERATNPTNTKQRVYLEDEALDVWIHYQKRARIPQDVEKCVQLCVERFHTISDPASFEAVPKQTRLLNALMLCVFEKLETSTTIDRPHVVQEYVRRILRIVCVFARATLGELNTLGATRVAECVRTTFAVCSPLNRALELRIALEHSPETQQLIGKLLWTCSLPDENEKSEPHLVVHAYLECFTLLIASHDAEFFLMLAGIQDDLVRVRALVEVLLRRVDDVGTKTEGDSVRSKLRWVFCAFRLGSYVLCRGGGTTDFTVEFANAFGGLFVEAWRTVERRRLDFADDERGDDAVGKRRVVLERSVMISIEMVRKAAKAYATEAERFVDGVARDDLRRAFAA